jgi:hypothetical protein
MATRIGEAKATAQASLYLSRRRRRSFAKVSAAMRVGGPATVRGTLQSC